MTDRPRTPADFIRHIAQVTQSIGAAVPGVELEDRLNREFSAGGAWFEITIEMCRRGIMEGWACSREAGGIKYGRVVSADHATHGMSVDLVEMADIVGPYHVHPNGEIDLVMPIDATAQFDGRGAGWKVYGPGSGHNPTVMGGKALILYLLPGGAIEFSRD